ncbi:hypothetical protein Ga0100231_019535 [Opitutaceae bacterium TAV4]|uniref:hypothetical protein n=1 Tax=Geminisphaera colitermitum TaxID=1148786 RepID=UPI000158CE8C|nr:hypothetical protein [Geminisphaera colitermitum]RRJ96131.1 hypothetical protein Ga0100231_019535 [Opitutaceae bacterium TAV4]RRK00271.1 hypothetical protein Ga0100230_020275 [Opitutaceae bacterium TAV3]
MKIQSTTTRTSIRIAINALIAAGALALVSGCHRHDDDHDHAKSSEAKGGGHKHEHTPPHGGTAVVLGDEAFHLEFVRNADAGKLQVYVMDGELEKFIRISEASFDVTAAVGGQPQTLTFKPVASPATGETVGNTSLYEAQADWIGTEAAENFDAVVEAITIKGTQFKAVKFNFPKGNEDDDKHDH